MGIFSKLFGKKDNKQRNVNKRPIDSKMKFEQIMKDKNISFFEAVWEYFLSIDTLKRFKDKYLSQLDLDCFEDELEGLTDDQVKQVKNALNEKVKEIKTIKYDDVFETVFKEEVKQEIEMSNEYASKYESPNKELDGFVLGGMVPDEYLEHLFNSCNGALFFFRPSITWNNDHPIINLDIDDGEIDWQPFG